MNNNFDIVNRLLATVYAIGLGIGEALKNWGDWQYAPLWIVDYIIVGLLLFGVIQQSKKVLLLGWSFSAGIMSMALFVNLAPEYSETFNTAPLIIFLTGLLLFTSIIGCLLSCIEKNH